MEAVERASRLVMAESVRNGIAATCKELQIWPPPFAPPGVAEGDCAFEDTSAPLLAIAQRAYNEERRRQQEGALQPLRRRAATASFLADFAAEVGVEPQLPDAYRSMLDEFMARVEEWVQTGSDAAADKGASLLKAASRARQALLMGLGLGAVADIARHQVQARWSKNWESPAGTMANVAAVGLALVAGYAAMRRATRPR